MPTIMLWPNADAGTDEFQKVSDLLEKSITHHGYDFLQLTFRGLSYIDGNQVFN